MRVMNIAVCVVTYKRPEGLGRVLGGIAELVFPREKQVRLTVMVIDNDPAGSASCVCDRLRPKIPWPLQYHQERKRGITYARNAAIRHAEKEHDGIAFIDDDEVPEPDWLDQLLFVQRHYDADVVTGPVLPVYHETSPDWSIRGRFFERPRHPTGYPMMLAATGNVLIKTDVFARITPAFDNRFALSGGEDTHFFMRVHRAGYRIVWANEAIVHEWVPKSRINVRWILQRAYRLGNTYSLCERDVQPSVKTIALRAAKGVARIGIGVVHALFAVFAGKAQLIQSLQKICLGAGMITGVAGSRYEEYQKTHGA